MQKRNRHLIFGLACLLAESLVFANPGVQTSSTFVLEKNQFPAALKKFAPQQIYLVYTGTGIRESWSKYLLRKDTILNLRGFLDSTKVNPDYRLIFGKPGGVDSVWQTDGKYRITDKAYLLQEGLAKFIAYDSAGKIADEFVYNFGKKYKERLGYIPSFDLLLRQVLVYSRSDRNNYAAGAAWVLSIGIDELKGDALSRLASCESDAIAYNRFFRQQFINEGNLAEGYHEYLLLGKNATKSNILAALKDIASRARAVDYFIFNFSGHSNVFTFDSITFSTYFFPYDFEGFNKTLFTQTRSLKDQINQQLVSLKSLQEYIQLIQAKNQLFISEAGPSESFKPEFIKTMMQGSPAIASLLNINRVIMVPNKMGMEMVIPQTGKIGGIIAYAVTSLDSTHNIFDLFDEYQASLVAVTLKMKAYSLRNLTDYFDVFFERKFLQDYRDIFGDPEKTRGGVGTNREVQKNPALKGNRYALVIGTDHYKGKGWDHLNNPVYDATEIAAILKEDYSYQVQLLTDPPMDSIYASIRNFYKSIGPDDQLVIYIAGHGDYDKELLDDGFIVCSDSRSVEEDPLRNTYIQHTKLKKMINKMPAKQVLVMLDICYGGFFDEEVRENPASAITNRNVLELLHNNEQYKVRKMLSSVGTEPAFDGKAGKHSPFASYLISVLNAKGGAEGIITLADIYALLQKASLNETATLKISPHVAGFGDNNPLGEFILVPVSPKK